MERMEALQLAVESEHCLRPAEAFALIGNETRVKILEALWHTDDEAVSFTTLHELVETDTSPQLNYHLKELTEQFIRKTPDGYELRTAGQKVVQAIVAGSFNAHPQPDPIDTGDQCTQCDGTLVATYDDETFAVDCPVCEFGHGAYPFPPGGFIDRDTDGVLRAFDRRVRHLHRLATDGICHTCSGRMTTEITTGDDCCVGTELLVQYRCQQCRHTLCSTVGLSLLDRPPVRSLYRDHGLDLEEIPYWQLEWCVSDQHTDVRSITPCRVDVSIPLADAELQVTLGEELEIIDATRETN